MVPSPYKVTELNALPTSLLQPLSMDSYHEYTPYASGGPLEFKVAFHLPTCDDIKDYIAFVSATVQAEPGRFVDVPFSPPAHWESRHPCLRPENVIEHLQVHGVPPVSVIRHLVRPANRISKATWGLIRPGGAK